MGCEHISKSEILAIEGLVLRAQTTKQISKATGRSAGAIRCIAVAVERSGGLAEGINFRLDRSKRKLGELGRRALAIFELRSAATAGNLAADGPGSLFVDEIVTVPGTGDVAPSTGGGFTDAEVDDLVRSSDGLTREVADLTGERDRLVAKLNDLRGENIAFAAKVREQGIEARRLGNTVAALRAAVAALVGGES
jgi:hypothetical protein